MSVPGRNAKKIIIHQGTVMISASWILMRIRELKARGELDDWAFYNKALTDVSKIIRKETHRVKWNAQNKRKTDQAKIQPQQPENG